MTAVLALFKREFLLGLRQRGETAASLVFVLLIVSLFPFALGPDEQLLQKLAPGLLLISLLLGQMLGFERLFSNDHQNGTLDVIAQSHLSLPVYALIKSMAQWCVLFFPVLVMSPVLMLLLHVEIDQVSQILIALLLASITIQLLGMLGAALSLGAKQGGVLMPLLLIPFYIPVMIFAVALAQNGFTGEGLQATYFLCALFFVYLVTLPILSGLALRSAIESS